MTLRLAPSKPRHPNTFTLSDCPQYTYASPTKHFTTPFGDIEANNKVLAAKVSEHIV